MDTWVRKSGEDNGSASSGVTLVGSEHVVSGKRKKIRLSFRLCVWTRRSLLSIGGREGRSGFCVIVALLMRVYEVEVLRAGMCHY